MLLDISFASKNTWIRKIFIDPQISKKRMSLYNKLNAVGHIYVSLECKESLLNTLIRSAWLNWIRLFEVKLNAHFFFEPQIQYFISILFFE